MTRYIDADVLLEELKLSSNMHAENSREFSLLFRNIVLVNEQPTADVAQVRHGKWIAVSAYDAFGGDEVMWNIHGNPAAFHYCSVCKEQAIENEEGEPFLPKYCPFCGALMDNGDDLEEDVPDVDYEPIPF